MKKAFRGINIAVILVALIATMTACNSYSWDAVGTTADSDKEATGNGTLYVQQGSYVYFVNGVVDDSSLTKADNEWGKASVKGSIFKAKVGDDGSLTVMGVVVPKLFISDYSDAGLYVYGQWIYYVTRSLKTDNKGSLISAVEFMRTKTDGTKTQSIAIVEDTSSNFIFTSTGLIYTYDSNIYYVSYTDKKVGSTTTVVEEYSEVLASEEDLCLFYTKASSNSLVSANNIGVVTSTGSSQTIISESTYSSEEAYYTDLDNLYTLALVNYDASENVLYYTKTCVNSAAKVGTYGFKFESGYTFDKTAEVKFANSALSSIYSLGIEKGIVDISSSTLKIYHPVGADGKDDMEEASSALASTIKVIFATNEYVYFAMSSSVYRADLFTTSGSFNSKAYTNQITEVKYDSTYGIPTVLGDYIIYMSSDDSEYLYRFDYTSFSVSGATITYAQGYIVSGYTTYEYDDDDDFVINKDDAVLEDKVPKYMTSDDLSTYIDNHKTENE